jgi:hypothetical protein
LNIKQSQSQKYFMQFRYGYILLWTSGYNTICTQNTGKVIVPWTKNFVRFSPPFTCCWWIVEKCSHHVNLIRCITKCTILLFLIKLIIRVYLHYNQTDLILTHDYSCRLFRFKKKLIVLILSAVARYWLLYDIYCIIIIHNKWGARWSRGHCAPACGDWS